MINISDRGVNLLIFFTSLASLVFALINSYRLSNVFSGMLVEQQELYTSNLGDIFLLLAMLAIAIFIKYRKQDGVKPYVLVRMYVLTMLSFYILLYLIGLNIGEDFAYSIFMPWWLLSTLSIVVLILSIVFVGKSYLMGKFRDFNNLFSILITLGYFYIFFLIITDSAAYLGIV